MKNKTPLLLALLVPGLASLAACDRNDHDAADAAPPPAAMTDPAPVEAMPAEAPPPAPIGDGMAGDEMTFAQLDRNGDGGISMDELSPSDMLHQHFSVADADGNGTLSDAEITKHRADMAGDEPR